MYKVDSLLMFDRIMFTSLIHEFLNYFKNKRINFNIIFDIIFRNTFFKYILLFNPDNTSVSNKYHKLSIHHEETTARLA